MVERSVDKYCEHHETLCTVSLEMIVQIRLFVSNSLIFMLRLENVDHAHKCKHRYCIIVMQIDSREINLHQMFVTNFQETSSRVFETSIGWSIEIRREAYHPRRGVAASQC